MGNITKMLRSFAREEDGASLAEYLVLLGVLVLAVAGGIAAFGSAINTAFQTWATWIVDNAGAPPPLSP